MRHKILIVDDAEAARRGLAEFFRRAGFDVIDVGTFAEGRAALAEQQPDLLIADVRLGEYNGLQLLATASRRTPAIVVTGYPDSVIEADAHGLGADYLVKPINPPELVALVQRKLEAAESGAFRPARRWERKQVGGRLAARVNDTPARVLDVSYGGLRVELERGRETPLPESFTLNLPEPGFSVNVDVVWTMQLGDQRWLCGGVVAQDTAAPAWHGLVDAVA